MRNFTLRCVYLQNLACVVDLGPYQFGPAPFPVRNSHVQPGVAKLGSADNAKPSMCRWREKALKVGSENPKTHGCLLCSANARSQKPERKEFTLGSLLHAPTGILCGL